MECPVRGHRRECDVRWSEGTVGEQACAIAVHVTVARASSAVQVGSRRKLGTP